MANTIETYGDSAVMAAFLTRSFSSVGYAFEDDVITTLKSYAFAGIKDLQRLSLPSLTMISACAFYQTEVSGTVTLPWNKITKIGSGAFCEGTALKDSALSLPALTELGTRAFADQSGLTSFSAPVLAELNSETTHFSVYKGVFEGSGIQTFSAPVFRDTNFSRQMFKDCTALTSVTMPNQTSVAESMFEGCTSLTAISLPAAIYCMANNGFRNCSALTSVSLPNVQYVTGTYLFYGCTALEEISLPSAQGTMGSSFFAGCTSLRTVSLPLIETLPTSCFNGCSALTFGGLSLPEVTCFGSASFQDCTALTSFESSNVDTLGSSCFSGCSNLEEVSFPLVTSIPQNCFYNCRKLVKAEFAGAVTSLAAAAFQYCTLLETVILSGVTAVPSITTTTFQYATIIVNKRGSIYVPDALVADFQAHSVWGLYDIQSINDLPEEGE